MVLSERQGQLCEDSKWDFSDLRAIFLNCTLKKSPELSHTLLKPSVDLRRGARLRSVTDLRQENARLKELVAETVLENRPRPGERVQDQVSRLRVVLDQVHGRLDVLLTRVPALRSATTGDHVGKNLIGVVRQVRE